MNGTGRALRRIHWKVSGTVQGVGFRWYVRTLAEEAGVAGWVRNLPDGRVEIVAEGAVDSLRVFEKAVLSGHLAGGIEAVEKQEEQATGEFRSFQIRF